MNFKKYHGIKWITSSFASAIYCRQIKVQTNSKTPAQLLCPRQVPTLTTLSTWPGFGLCFDVKAICNIMRNLTCHPLSGVHVSISSSSTWTSLHSSPGPAFMKVTSPASYWSKLSSTLKHTNNSNDASSSLISGWCT